jgi:hypothetical protein
MSFFSNNCNEHGALEFSAQLLNVCSMEQHFFTLQLIIEGSTEKE